MTINAEKVKDLRDRTGVGILECKKALEESEGDIEKAIEIMRKAGQAKALKRASRTAAEGVVVIKTSSDNKTSFMVEINTETDFVARDESFKRFSDAVAIFGLENGITDLSSLLNSVREGQTLSIAQECEELIAKIGEKIQIRRVFLLHGDATVGVYSHGGRIGVMLALSKDEPVLAKDIAMHIAASKPEVILPDDLPQSLIDKEKEIRISQAEKSGKPKEIIEKMIEGQIKKFVNEVSLVGQPFVKDTSITVGELLNKADAEVLSFVRFEVGEGIEKEQADFAKEVMEQISRGK